MAVVCVLYLRSACSCTREQETHHQFAFALFGYCSAAWAFSSRTNPEQGAPRLFGAGFFDDAGDIPGTPLLFYTLQDTSDANARDGADGADGADGVEAGASFTKRYLEPASVYKVDYQVQHLPDLAHGLVANDATAAATTTAASQPVINGQWFNRLEGTHGTFAARLEENI